MFFRFFVCFVIFVSLVIPLFQNQYSYLAIGLKLISGGVHTFTGRSRTVDQDITFAHAGEEQIVHHFRTLAVDLRINQVNPMGASAVYGNANVVRRSSYPHLLLLISLRALPEADVMSFGKSIILLLK